MKSYILLIEDDDWLAESYQSVITAANVMVRHVHSASEAMNAIDEQLPQVIVADILLGDENSITLFHELQSYDDTAQIPVIVCTTLAAELKDFDLKKYGVVMVLDKLTLTPDILVSRIGEWLERK